jgi:hypothetical protein
VIPQKSNDRERLLRIALFVAGSAFLFGGALFVGVGFAPARYWRTLEVLAWALMILGALGVSGTIGFMCAQEAPPPLDCESTIQPFMQKRPGRK